MITTIAGLALSGGSRRLLMLLGGALLLIIAVAFAAWRGYQVGYDRADATRRAEVAELQSGHSQALAQAEIKARAMFTAEMRRANALEQKYLDATKTIAVQRRTITNKRIRNANRDLDPDGLCRFGSEWVRLYNKALGAGTGDGEHELPATAPSTAGEARAGDAAQAGILPGGTAVTPADILAHVRDYGSRCQRLEAQLDALIEWAKERGKAEEQAW